MVTVKDLGDTVEIAFLLPVERKEYESIANKTGYTLNDIKCKGMVITMKTSDFIFFVQDVMEAHTKFQDDRANAIKRTFDTATIGE